MSVLLRIAATVLIAATAAAQTPADPLAEVQAAEKLAASGDLPAAASELQRIVTASPKSFAARLAFGRVLDLQFRHVQARAHLEEAVKIAKDSERNSALTALGISYAFESKPDEAARYYQRAFDSQIQADDRGGAAALANGIARIYLESGNLKKAEQWYTTGYETARKIAALTPTETTLWEMRRHNALGRIAARQGNAAAAREHADAVRELLDRGGNDNQRPFYPYLLGYIAFFARDYRTAIDELSKGDLNDPFVLGLIGQSHERLKQRDQAAEFYRKVMAINTHNINAAFARPRARAFLR